MSARSLHRSFFLALAPSLALGCAAAHEGPVRDDLRATARTLDAPDAPERPPPDGPAASYVAYAMARSPALRAAYQRWRAETLRIAPARQLPDPTIAYGFYALPVQTRVGPQRHRLSARQEIPWPTRLTGAADAQGARARAAQRRFEARALDLRRRVAEAWWRIWVLRRVRDVQREQLEILAGLAETARARLEVGEAGLAEVQPIDLRRSRLDDALQSLALQERAAAAALRAAIGASPDLPVPTPAEVPPPALPGEETEALRRAVRTHPLLETFALAAEAREAEAASLEARRFPSFTVGVDWIETGPAPTPVQGSGDDALILNLGVRVPLWQGAYDDAQRAAEAEAEAERADGRAAEDAALAELVEAHSAVVDSHRRIELLRGTLLPQAVAAYEAVVGSYAAGRAGVADTLWAQRDLLELTVELARARADHGRAWARLERVVGRPVRTADRREGGDR
ncbi:MAG TPA: TolC family protein [Sandaracinaceae bacterium LLY-WYZ-13_1]|nr:TolC family protein [Sandaracinaceae bacterium LLY-WYZ-13_1]